MHGCWRALRAGALSRDLEARHQAWVRSANRRGQLLDTLRRAHHAETFRTLVRDVESGSTVEQVADDLSALADAMLDLTLSWAWRHLRQRHRANRASPSSPTASSAARSWGYGSDLDIVFLTTTTTSAPRSARLARKVISWLSLHRRRRAVRDRHRAAPERQLGPAGHLDRGLRALPEGAAATPPGPGDIRPSPGRAGARAMPAWRALRGSAPRGADRAARPGCAARARSPPCASGCADIRCDRPAST